MDLEREKQKYPAQAVEGYQNNLWRNSKKSSMRSSKGHEYKFKSSDQNKLKRAMDKIEKLQKEFERDMERAQKEFGESLNNVLSNADIILKN